MIRIAIEGLAGAFMLAVIALGVPRLIGANGHRRFVVGLLVILCIVFAGFLNYIGPGWQGIRPFFYIGIGGTALWTLRIWPFNR